jgi:ribose 5-phosphate isomerase B
MKIFIASDHAGFDLKNALLPYISELGHESVDMGAYEMEPMDDYPEFVQPCAQRVAETADSIGIVIGGSGQGEAMVSNRVRGVRAVVFYGTVVPKGAIDVNGNTDKDPYIIVRLARIHNDANVISFGARFITEQQAKEALSAFLSTPFSGDARHKRRISEFNNS